MATVWTFTCWWPDVSTGSRWPMTKLLESVSVLYDDAMVMLETSDKVGEERPDLAETIKNSHAMKIKRGYKKKRLFFPLKIKVTLILKRIIILWRDLSFFFSLQIISNSMKFFWFLCWPWFLKYCFIYAFLLSSTTPAVSFFFFFSHASVHFTSCLTSCLRNLVGPCQNPLRSVSLSFPCFLFVQLEIWWKKLFKMNKMTVSVAIIKSYRTIIVINASDISLFRLMAYIWRQKLQKT